MFMTQNYYTHVYDEHDINRFQMNTAMGMSRRRLCSSESWMIVF